MYTKHAIRDRCFCTNQVFRGSPLSCTGNYFDGVPEVVLYNGKNFCGVSNCAVVNIDEIRHGLSNPYIVPEGGIISICFLGSVFISHELVINFSEASDKRYIKPTKKGLWKLQQRRTKKTVGMMKLIHPYGLEITLF